MLRALGVLLLAGSGLTLGLGAIGSLTGQLRDLTDLESALSMLEGELRLSMPSTPALLDTLARRVPGRAGDFFQLCGHHLERLGEQDFESLWAEAVQEAELRLPHEEERQLVGFGKALGRYDGEHLLKSCQQTREALEKGAERVRQSIRSQSRVYGTLGLSIGVFLAIVLL